MKKMHVVTADGRVYAGAAAFARILASIPLVGWLAYVYYVPGIKQLADLALRPHRQVPLPALRQDRDLRRRHLPPARRLTPACHRPPGRVTSCDDGVTGARRSGRDERADGFRAGPRAAVGGGGARSPSPGLGVAWLDAATRHEQLQAWPRATAAAYVGTLAARRRPLGRARPGRGGARRVGGARRARDGRGVRRRHAALLLRALPRVHEPAGRPRRHLHAPERRAAALERPRELPPGPAPARRRGAAPARGARVACSPWRSARAAGRSTSALAALLAAVVPRAGARQRRAGGGARRPLPRVDGQPRLRALASTTSRSSAPTPVPARRCPCPPSRRGRRAAQRPLRRDRERPRDRGVQRPLPRLRDDAVHERAPARTASASRRCARSTRRPPSRSPSSGAASRRPRRARRSTRRRCSGSTRTRPASTRRTGRRRTCSSPTRARGSRGSRSSRWVSATDLEPDADLRDRRRRRRSSSTWCCAICRR